jgi:DNA repair protein RecN (Recombination protein N)
MLSHLSIRHFAIVEQLDIEFQSGTTVITGETGAGKSIMLDALSMVLGSRADSQVIAPGHNRADISATFDLGKNPQARQWLLNEDFPAFCESGEHRECIIQRTLTREGRSRASINGQPVTLQQLKSFGNLCVTLHSQHEHHSLLLRETQREILDSYNNGQQLVQTVRQAFFQWKRTHDMLETLRNQSDEAIARQQLLQYQVEELDQLNLEAGELDSLETSQQQLAHAETLLHSGESLMALCDSDAGPATNHSIRHSEDRGETGLRQLLSQALHMLQHDFPVQDEGLNTIRDLLTSANINIEEACNELLTRQQGISVDPENLQRVEARLATTYQLARKHRVQAEELPILHQQLKEELSGLDNSDEYLERLQGECDQFLTLYKQAADELTTYRNKTAEKLSGKINRELKSLHMGSCNLVISLAPHGKETPQQEGNETVEFLIQTNPGLPFQPIRKIASGGELSRISLAVQVVTAKTSSIPTLIFDEVDVGIGGDTADRVGQLLQKLGKASQVLCVTHQATVASRADHHLFVTKSVLKGKTRTTLNELDCEKRIEEVARMIGGSSDREQSLAHAAVMLETRHG